VVGLTQPATEEDIADVILSFAQAAANAKSVGFDAIAIHGAHGYLIDNFLWEKCNYRNDAWGGDIPRRSRVASEIVRAIRREVGEAFPIIFRFSQWKLQDLDARIANSPRELDQALGPIADAGVDVFDASVRNFDLPVFEGSALGLAGWAKKLTGKLSMTVGSVGLSKALLETAGDVEVASDKMIALQKRFERGEFDLVAVGRMLITDPQWVRKVRRGEPLSPFHPSSLAVLY
jgi:2,4-dienoyl-CoA reductase-like NADH-dependent reductase (Old Yellow Enzyme family)